MRTAATFDLTGRTALVTGASSGLGARFAKILSASGARVVLAARRTERLESLKTEIVDSGGHAMCVAMDVSDETSTISAYNAVEAKFGTIDTIIANAGISHEGLAVEQSSAAFAGVFATNVLGVFLTLREGARRMIASGSRERGTGRIVIISSITAKIVTPRLVAYSASKAAVVHMGRIMAREWVRAGINVNTVLPGYIRTELNADWFDSDGGKRQIAGFPRRRLMSDNQLDAMILYLCSDASAEVTGGEFILDDGQTL